MSLNVDLNVDNNIGQVVHTPSPSAFEVKTTWSYKKCNLISKCKFYDIVVIV